MIAVGDRTVKIWDAVTGHVKATLEGHSRVVKSVAISHEGATIVSGSGELSDGRLDEMKLRYCRLDELGILI